MEGISLGVADYPWHNVVLSLPKQLVGGQPVPSLLLGEGWTVLETIPFPGQIPSFMACFVQVFQFFS